MGCFPNHSWKETLAKGWLGRRRRFWSRNTGNDGAVYVFSSLCCDGTLAPLPWNTISVEGLATVVASRLGAMHTFTLFLFWIRLSCHPTLSRFTASCVCVCRVRWCHRNCIDWIWIFFHLIWQCRYICCVDFLDAWRFSLSSNFVFAWTLAAASNHYIYRMRFFLLFLCFFFFCWRCLIHCKHFRQRLFFKA